MLAPTSVSATLTTLRSSTPRERCSNSLFSNNTANYGGGLYNNGTVTITGALAKAGVDKGYSRRAHG